MSDIPPNTRTSMTDEQLERLLAAIHARGANVNVSDPRVSAVQAWVLGLVGTGIVGGLLMLSSSVIELRAEVAQWRDRWQTLEDHEERIRQLERRP